MIPHRPEREYHSQVRSPQVRKMTDMSRVCSMMSRRLLRGLAAVPVLLALCIQGAAAQRIDHRGREFWVAFMPNLGSQSPIERSRLRLYLLSGVDTKATITYTLTGASREIEVAGGTFVNPVDLNALFGDMTELDDFTIGNSVTGRSFLILADDDIAVIGANLRQKSADAFLALPLGALDSHYIALAYPNGYTSAGQGAGDYDTQSEFAVVAVADGTRLNVSRPAGSTTINGRTEETFSVMLNRGEVFLGQAQLNADADVSGTELSADHPVAVFAGTKRASVPSGLGNYRDHMVEQLVPDRYWRTGGMAAPRFVFTERTSDTILYRVAARDTGTVSFTSNGVTRSMYVRAREICSFTSDSAVRIDATVPVLAALYEPSQGIPGSPKLFMGDPSMSLIASPEQWDTEYMFVNLPEADFTIHYVAVIAPRGAELVLDGSPVVKPRRRIDDAYDYIQIQIFAGSHRLNSSVPVGVTVYGVSDAVSYAYPAGLVLQQPTQGAAPSPNAGGRISLRALPNPVTGAELVLDVLARRAVRIGCEIVDERGELVTHASQRFDIPGGAGRIRLDIRGLPCGIYFCRVSTEGNESATVKFVRQ